MRSEKRISADQKLVLAHGEITDTVLRAFFDVYNDLGFGFLEGVYRNALLIALRQAGVAAQSEVPMAVRFRGVCVGEYRADLIVAESVIVEVKALTAIARVHETQLVNYLKATGLNVGLLLNFGPKLEFRRKVYKARS